MVSLMGSTSGGRYLYAQIVGAAMQRTEAVEHHGVGLSFAVPNAQNKFRVDTFSEKEPETLDWIDEMTPGSVLWDIGANVGLYSCYAAKRKGCRVFAFEPSVFNLELLARNVFVNNLAALVTIVPLPLSESRCVSTFNMTTTDWGGALSTFGESYGYDGKPLVKKFEFATVGLSMNDAAELLRIPPPDYIKMDVDGIEHLILKGGVPQLETVKSILIEINDAFQSQAQEAEQYLAAAGLHLKEKRRWKGTDGSSFETAFNQIWNR
ncbi:MAG: Methyltransferase [Gemmatimonadetes bacterium]|nr:Methyltransferase [Gemmatimonadota bacterium]